MTSGYAPFSADCTIGDMDITLNIALVIRLPLVEIREVRDEPG